MNARDDAWILTFTGRRAWPLDPRPEDICIEDIAHALALTCRFTGHCREFYSVAQHSVLVSHYVSDQGGDAGLQLAALLHDASEAYLPDVARPIKGRLLARLPDGWRFPAPVRFSKAEERLMDAIVLALGDVLEMTFDLANPLIKQADIALLLSERRDLLPPDDLCWAKALGAEHVPLWKDTILPWEPKHAETRFLAEFRQLSREVSRG